MFIKNEFEMVTFRNFGLCLGNCVYYFHSQYFGHVVCTWFCFIVIYQPIN